MTPERYQFNKTIFSLKWKPTDVQNQADVEKKINEDSEIKNRKLSFENYSAKKQIQMNVQELFYQLCMESGNVEITV